MDSVKRETSSASRANTSTGSTTTSFDLVRRYPAGASVLNSSTRRILNQFNTSSPSLAGATADSVFNNNEVVQRVLNESSNNSILLNGTGGGGGIGMVGEHDLVAAINAVNLSAQSMTSLNTELARSVEMAIGTLSNQNESLLKTISEQQKTIMELQRSLTTNSSALAQHSQDAHQRKNDAEDKLEKLTKEMMDLLKETKREKDEAERANREALSAARTNESSQPSPRQQLGALPEPPTVPSQAQLAAAANYAAQQYYLTNAYNHQQQHTHQTSYQPQPQAHIPVQQSAGVFWSVNQQQNLGLGQQQQGYTYDNNVYVTADAHNTGTTTYPLSGYQQQPMPQPPSSLPTATGAGLATSTSTAPVPPAKGFAACGQQTTSQLQNLLQQENVAPSQPQGQGSYQGPANPMETMLKNQLNPNFAIGGTEKSPLNPTQQQKPVSQISFPVSSNKPLFGGISSGSTGVANTSGLTAAVNTSGAGRTRNSESESDDHFEPQVDFKPVVPLPDLVEITTGEEEEEVLFSSRAKLFRWVLETKEFKERGLGDMKILQHKQTKKVRVVMRREQVLKLCANHNLDSSMELKPMEKSETSWMWKCVDFSEDEPKNEMLAIRFKTKDQAMEFKRVFDNGVAEVGKLKGSTPKKAEVGGKTEEKPGFGSQFLKKQGDWTCKGCMVTNDSEKASCPCCGTSKDGAPAQKPSLFGSTNDSTKISTTPLSTGFGGGDQMPQPFVFGFGGAKKDEEKKTTDLNQPPNSTPTAAVSSAPAMATTATTSSTSVPSKAAPFSFGGFSFNKQPVVESKPDPQNQNNTTITTTKVNATAGQSHSPSSKPQSPFSKPVFGKPLLPIPTAAPETKPTFGNFSFVGTTATSTSTSATTLQKVEPTEKEKGIFGSLAGSGGVSFAALASKSPESASFQKPTTPTSFPGAGTKLFGGSSGTANPSGAGRTRNSESESDDHFEPQVEFKPVVPLPDLVEVTTGEEEEEVLFSSRAKLFRWVLETKEFKERGLGDMKILQHKETKKVRVVMRREQVLKLCANHNLDPSMELKPMEKSETSWMWKCVDFSEDNEAKNEMFAIRFKTKDQAMEFKRVFDEGRNIMEKLKGSTPTKAEPKISSEQKTGFGSEFMKKEGDWTCKGCMVTNDKEKTVCPCCGASKDATPVQKPSLFGNTAFKSDVGTAGSFSFGFGAAKKEEDKDTSVSFSFKPSSPKDSKPKDTEKEDLKLPDAFYTDETSECSGCLGCGNDEEMEKALLILTNLAVASVPPTEEEEGEGEEESTDEEQVMWEAQATLLITNPDDSNAPKNRVVGCIRVTFDDDVDGCRLIFDDSNGKRSLNHIIVMNYSVREVEVGKKSGAQWSALDYSENTPVRREFTLLFSSSQKRQEFVNEFTKGVDQAKVMSLSEGKLTLNLTSQENASSYNALLSRLMANPNPTQHTTPR